MDRRNALRNTVLFTGTGLLAPTMLGLLQSCQEKNSLHWEPMFLSKEQAQFMSALVDTLLPRTETPGGLDVKVDIFMDLVFDHLYEEPAQAALVREIEQFNQKCKDRFGAGFANLSQEERIEVLKTAEAESGKYNPSVWGTAVGKQKPVGFYRSMKSLALWAFFSSEEIGKNILNYDPVPGDYKGCIPLLDTDKVSAI